MVGTVVWVVADLVLTAVVVADVHVVYSAVTIPIGLLLCGKGS